MRLKKVESKEKTACRKVVMHFEYVNNHTRKSMHKKT